MSTEHKATLSFTDGTPSVEFPIHKGTIGPDVIDIRKLYGSTGNHLRSWLPVHCILQFLHHLHDGDKGELLYRGYPIEQLAQQCDFMDVCYLLLTVNCRMWPKRRLLTIWSPSTPW